MNANCSNARSFVRLRVLGLIAKVKKLICEHANMLMSSMHYVSSVAC